MAKLTHIEDVERRNAEAEDEREMLEAQEALQRAEAQRAKAAAEKSQAEQAEEAIETLQDVAEGEPILDVTSEAKEEAEERTAEEELEFHGLSSDDSMGAMQKVLIALAAIVFIAAILYVVNSWVHFV